MSNHKPRSNGPRAYLDPPLTALNGRVLKILAVCRISTVHQDERSLADQEASYRDWIERHTDLPYEMVVISSQGSGECIDRKEYLRTIELVESGEFDLVVTEDLGRICRRVHAHIFCETCEDAGTRLISLNDHVDTAKDGWQMNSLFAAMHHETHNRDASNRICRSQRNRFLGGGVVQTVIAGYIKPEGAKTDSELQKDPAAEPIYDQWFQMLENGASFAEVADWLNEIGFETGPYVRAKQWSGTLVGQVTRNPILKGVRVRNRKISRRNNKTGRRRSVKAPPEALLERHCPHLAFIEPDRYDSVILMLEKRNTRYRRVQNGEKDPRAAIPKKRTRFPGQAIYCGICGRIYVFGGHGRKDHLMCSGAREHKCWNGVTVDGPLAAQKISEAVIGEIQALDGFDQAFMEMVERQARQTDEQHEKTRRDLLAKLARNQRQLENATNFILSGKNSPTIHKKIEELENEQSQLSYELRQLDNRPTDQLAIPSAEELRRLARDAFAALTLDSFEFARLMRSLIPKIIVFPFRLCDGGRVVLRAKFRLQLAGLHPDPRVREVLDQQLQRILTINLFEPCQRAAVREAIVDLRKTIDPKTGKIFTLAAAAAKIGITATAAQRAVALQRLMDELGLTDTYIPVHEPPEDLKRLRRHKHARYSFEPLEDAGQL